MYRRPARSPRQFQARQGQTGEIGLSLQGLQPPGGQQPYRCQGKAQGLVATAPQPPQSLAHQHRRSAAIAAFEMEFGHGDLQQALEHGPDRSLGLVPELLEAVVA